MSTNSALLRSATQEIVNIHEQRKDVVVAPAGLRHCFNELVVAHAATGIYFFFRKKSKQNRNEVELIEDKNSSLRIKRPRG